MSLLPDVAQPLTKNSPELAKLTSIARISRPEFTQPPTSTAVGAEGRCKSGGNRLATEESAAWLKPYNCWTTSPRNSPDRTKALATLARPIECRAFTQPATSALL